LGITLGVMLSVLVAPIRDLRAAEGDRAVRMAKFARPTVPPGKSLFAGKGRTRAKTVFRPPDVAFRDDFVRDLPSPAAGLERWPAPRSAGLLPGHSCSLTSTVSFIAQAK
jgi:hypothetical protein